MKVAHGLIPIGSHQVVVNEYTRQMQRYLEDKSDGVISDTYWSATVDKRIAGIQKEMQFRETVNHRLTINAFQAFQKIRKAEIEAKIAQIQAEQQSVEQIQAIIQRDKSILPSALEMQNDLLSLQEELDALQKSTSFADFARKTGQFQSYNQELDLLNKLAKRMEDSDKNKETVLDTIETIHPFIDSRYNMMQSIAFALKEDETLPILAYNKNDIVSHYSNTAKGLKEVQKKQHEGLFATQKGRDEHIRTCLWDNVYHSLSEVEGLSNAYEDAISTIMNSDEWQNIRHYIRMKAAQNNQSDKIIAFDGLRSSLMYYIDKHPNMGKPDIPNLFDYWDKAEEKQTAFMNTHKIYTEIRPVLDSYAERVQLYHFLQQTIQEYQNDKKKNPKEFEHLSAMKDVYPLQTGKLLELSTEKFREDDYETTHRLSRCAARLVDKDKLGASIYEGAMIGLAVVPMGAGLVGIGVGIASTVGISAGLSVTTIETDENGNKKFGGLAWEKSKSGNPRTTCMQAVQNKLAELPGMQKLAEIADTHIREEMEEYHENSRQREKNAIDAINQIPIDDFDKALSFAMNCTNTAIDNDILNFVHDARQLQNTYKNEEEFINAYTEHQNEFKQNDINLSLEPDNAEYILKQNELKYNELLFQAAITGRYFAMASIYHYDNGEPMVRSYDTFEGANLQALKHLEQAIAAANSAEYELQLRSEIITNWQKRGKPIVETPHEEDETEAMEQMLKEHNWLIQTETSISKTTPDNTERKNNIKNHLNASPVLDEDTTFQFQHFKEKVYN
ncbi:MAG: hypothetical protein IKJ28_04480 [Alphaproteobacteria bacterium]|nr:hypothetical protein [Alphaproteobacteria bacterium]